MYTKRQLFIVVIITAIIFTVVGFFINRLKNNTFQAGLDAAYQRLISSGNASIAVRGYGYRESKNIGGFLKEIYPTKIILNVDPINPLADPKLKTRSIEIINKTKIYKQVEKTIEQQEQDAEEFKKKMKLFNENPEAEIPELPDLFNKQEIEISDLKIGDRIIATAENNIHDQKEFKALEIILEF